MAFSPFEQRSAAVAREHDAGRELVGRRDEHRVGGGRRERVDVDPLGVDRDRDELEPAPRGDLPDRRMARVLDRQPSPPGPDEDGADEADRLREARADERVLRVADDPADATQVAAERLAQLRGAADVAVGELAVGGAPESGAIRPQPLVAGKGAVVGHVRPQVVEPGLVGRERTRPWRHLDAARDDGWCVPPEPEVALGAELRVRGDDEAAGDAELGRERARRRQLGPGTEGAAPHRFAQRALELERKRLRRAPVQLDEHFRRAACPRRVVHKSAPKLDLNTGPRTL